MADRVYDFIATERLVVKVDPRVRRNVNDSTWSLVTDYIQPFGPTFSVLPCLGQEPMSNADLETVPY